MSFMGLLGGQWRSVVVVSVVATINLLVLSLDAHASQKVYFAGFALAGDASSIENGRFRSLRRSFVSAQRTEDRLSKRH